MAVMEGDGRRRHISPTDKVMVELLAVTLRCIRQVEEHLNSNGLVASDGVVRPAAEYLVRLLREARACCEALVMTQPAQTRPALDRVLAAAPSAFSAGHSSPGVQETGKTANVQGGISGGRGKVTLPLPATAPGPADSAEGI